MEAWHQFLKRAINCEKILLNSNLSEEIIIKAQKRL